MLTMIKRRLFQVCLVICVLLSSVFSFSQTDSQIANQKKPFAERIFVGGSLGFSIGTYSSLVDVSPIFGYEVTDDFIAGDFDTSYLDTHPDLFDYDDNANEASKLANLIAEIHHRGFNPYAA